MGNSRDVSFLAKGTFSVSRYPMRRAGQALPLPYRVGARLTGVSNLSLPSPWGRGTAAAVDEVQNHPRGRKKRERTPSVNAYGVATSLMEGGIRRSLPPPRLPLRGSWHGEAVTEGVRSLHSQRREGKGNGLPCARPSHISFFREKPENFPETSIQNRFFMI